MKPPRNAVVLAAGAALAILVGPSLPASASASDTSPIVLATEPPTSYHRWHFGGPEGQEPIETGVRTIVVDLGLPIQGSIDCWVKTPSEFAEVTKTEAEWLASPAISLGDDFTLLPGQNVQVTCRTGEEGYWAGFYIMWSMVAVAGSDESIALPVDPAMAWSRHDTNYVSTRNPEVVPARVGDEVQVIGPAGTFLPNERLNGSFGGENIEEDGWFDGVYFSQDGAVSPDGSTLSFTIPSDDNQWIDDDKPTYARFISGRTSDELPPGPSQSSRTIWYGGFDLRESSDHHRAASTVRVGLSLHTAFSLQRVRATAVIDVPPGHPTDGTVTFFINNRAVGSADITATSDHRATLLLPRLSRGGHTITAQYTGNDRVAPSASSPASLRILL